MIVHLKTILLKDPMKFMNRLLHCPHLYTIVDERSKNMTESSNDSATNVMSPLSKLKLPFD